MSLTWHQEIGRIGRVGKDVTRVLRGRYEETAPVEFKLDSAVAWNVAAAAAADRPTNLTVT